MKWIVIIVVAILAEVALVYLVGSLLPVQHTATVTASLQNSPDEVWSTISDPRQFATWRSGLKSVEVTDERNWKEISSQGDEIIFQAVIWEPGKKLVTRIMNQDLPFGGEWVYEFQADGKGTRLTITENGEVYNPVFRFMSKYVFGHDTTLKNYVADLEKTLLTVVR